MSHWQACINFQITKQAGGLPVSAVGDKQANLDADRRSRAGDDTTIGLVERGLQAGVRRTSRGGGADNLQECRCRASEGYTFPSAIETHPGPFMIGVNEVVSGAKPAKDAMTAAAAKANAAIADSGPSECATIPSSCKNTAALS